MRTWNSVPAVPPAQFLISSAALQVSSLISESPAELRSRAEQLRRLRGCSDSGEMLSIDGSKHGICSLTLTLIAQAVAG
jgi:hypothetical protein